MDRRPSAHEFRIARVASKVLTRAASLGWLVAPWVAEFRVHPEIPFPACPDGCVLDISTGLLLGWDGRVSVYCEHFEGSPAGVLVGIWGERRQLNPGNLGCEKWWIDCELDAVGAMYAPRKLV